MDPLPLPHCAYPSAADVVEHGVQKLPAILPLVDFETARPHRSNRYTAVPAAYLTPAQLMRLAKVVGASFCPPRAAMSAPAAREARAGGAGRGAARRSVR